MTAGRWSPEDDAQLIALLNKKTPVEKIVKITGRSTCSINCRKQVLRDRGAIEFRRHSKKNNPAQPASTPEKKPRFTIRPCLCCQTNFKSEGPMNRLCPSCRRTSVSVYAP